MLPWPNLRMGPASALGPIQRRSGLWRGRDPAAIFDAGSVKRAWAALCGYPAEGASAQQKLTSLVPVSKKQFSLRDRPGYTEQEFASEMLQRAKDGKRLGASFDVLELLV
jgi:hypothetical protein